MFVKYRKSHVAMIHLEKKLYNKEFKTALYLVKLKIVFYDIEGIVFAQRVLEYNYWMKMLLG
jgi:hypothetical protein